MYPTFKRGMAVSHNTAIFFKVSLLLLAQFILLSTYLSAQNTPVISSFSPISAKQGDAVTLAGKGFNNTTTNSIVFFGATKATVTAATATKLTVTVPTGATYVPTYNPAKTWIGSSDFIDNQYLKTGNGPVAAAIGDNN